MSVAIWWIRHDLRLDDNPALRAAMRAGSVLPLYIHAPEEDAPWAPGAASLAWLARSLRALQRSLARAGSTLVLREGPTLSTLQDVISETGATSVHWNRRYEPASITRDAQVKRALLDAGIAAESHNGALLLEPWQVKTGSGEPYRVFTPYWRNVRARLDTLPAPEPRPRRLAPPPSLASVPVRELLPAPRPRWDRGFWSHWQPGERGARARLEAFIEGAIVGYRELRDRPDRTGTSRLSPHLHFGEISPRRILARLRRESWPAAAEADVEGFVRELGWREFSVQLLYHFPQTPEGNLNRQFDAFPWAPDEASALDAFQRGRTGVPIVDAGMRELWHSGFMHNRVRMIVASFLTKNLRQHWNHGARWFWDTLVDADLANNTQGWQWSAGTGADAAPYFRIFNPVSQAQRFDPDGAYIRRWVPELAALPTAVLFAPWEHPELLRRTAPGYPSRPIVDLRESREAALAAYQQMRAERLTGPVTSV